MRFIWILLLLAAASINAKQIDFSGIIIDIPAETSIIKTPMGAVIGFPNSNETLTFTVIENADIHKKDKVLSGIN